VSDDISIPRPGFAASRRGQKLEPGTKRLIWIAAGLVVGLGGIVGVSTLVGRRSAEAPVVQADARPIRVKPDNPGGLQVAGTNNEIFSGGSDTGGSKLAPPLEAPNPKGLNAPPVALAAPAALPSIVAAQPQAAAPVAIKPPAPPVAAVTPKPAPKPLAGKGPTVQLAAVASEASAHAEWQVLVKKMPDVLSGRQPNFAKVERDGKSYWRVRTAGFTDVSAAKTFCEHVRAKGAGCSVADF
jgi:hypothetical protein